MNQAIFGITYIDDAPWIVTLPDGGTAREAAEQSEFGHFVTQAGKDTLHCEMGSWCKNWASETRWDEAGEGFVWRESGPVCQYDGSSDFWDICRSHSRRYSVGFRPVLIPADPNTLQPDPTRLSHLKDGTILCMGSLYMSDQVLRTPSDPVGCGQPKYGMSGPPLGDVPKYIGDTALRIGDTHSDPDKQIQFIKLGDRLVSDRVILGCVSMDDLNTHLKLQPCPPARTLSEKTTDGPIELWGRLGFFTSVTPQELDVLRGEHKTAQALLLDLIQSGRCSIYGDTYFPEPANDKYLTEDLNFDLPEIAIPGEPSKAKEVELPAFDQRLSSAKTRSATGQSVPSKTPEH